MDYPKLKNRNVLSALTRLVACLECYGHSDFVDNVLLWKDQYLSGSRSLSNIKKLVLPYVLVSISELSFDMRQCYMRDSDESFNVARNYAMHIKVLTILL